MRFFVDSIRKEEKERENIHEGWVSDVRVSNGEERNPESNLHPFPFNANVNIVMYSNLPCCMVLSKKTIFVGTSHSPPRRINYTIVKC